jgi:multiple sugar transport system substrate-binding protein
MTKDYSPLVLYYNKDMFKEADLEFPSSDWTWDDLLDAARTLTVDADGNSAASADFDPENVERWGIQLPDTWGDPLWLRGILPFIYQNGGSVINGDGTQVTGHLNGPETVEALEWYVDLFQTHYVAPDREDVQALSGVDLFQSELTAMVWTGRWPLKDYLANPDLNFGTMGLPAGPTGTKANTLCWAGFGIYAESDNKETAWAFLKHIGAGEGAEEFAKYAFTAVEPIAELQGLDSDPYNAPIVEDLENVVQLPDFTTPKFGECVESNFREELEKVFLQDKAVQAAMDDVAALADSCLAEGD